jgi:hypothetical protein
MAQFAPALSALVPVHATNKVAATHGFNFVFAITATAGGPR